jgi:hypothetical protein
MNHRGSTQLPLTLGRHFGQDVALVSALTLVTTRRFLEPLSGPAVNFCFGHLYYSALAQTDRSAVVKFIGTQGIHGPLSPFFGGDHHGQLSAFHFWKLLDTAQFGQIGFYSLE